MTKTVYAYAALDGKYDGERTLDDTDCSPISGAWQIPAYMTETSPPAAKEGYDLYWRGGKWEQVEKPKPEPTPAPPEDTEPQEMAAQSILVDEDIDTSLKALQKAMERSAGHGD